MLYQIINEYRKSTKTLYIYINISYRLYILHAKHNIPYYPTTTKNAIWNDYGYKQDTYATTVDTDEIGDLRKVTKRFKKTRT